MNGLINLIANIVLLGLIVWLINVFIPLPGIIYTLLNLVVLVVCILYVLQFFKLIAPIVPMLQIVRF